MAIILTNTNASTSLTTGTSHLIVEGVTQYSFSNAVTAAVNATAINYSILGTIASLGANGISAQDGGNNQEVFVGSQGNILAETTGIRLGDGTDDSRIVNNGSISGNVAVFLGGNISNITNTGTMTGALTDGIELGASANNANILNSGAISGNQRGINIASSDVVLTNSGTIQGGSIGVYMASSGDISNSGTIIGSDNGIEAVGRANILNSGSILGGIDLGVEDDTYDGTAGRVTGLVSLGRGDDTFRGGEASDWVVSGDGNDTIYGNGGDDELIATFGGNRIYGGSGDDRLFSITGFSELYGESGSDYFKVSGLGAFNSRYDGGSGEDTFDFSLEGGDPDFFDAFVGFISLASGATSQMLSPHIIGFEHFRSPVSIGTFLGSDDDNTLIFDSVSEVRSYGGDDTITTRNTGGIYSGGGNDAVSVGTGFYGIVNLGSGDDSFVANGFGTGVFGGTGDDRLIGAGQDDKLRGNQGNDYLEGNAGSDNLSGQDGDDRLVGGDGMDALLGGNGNDALFGGDAGDALFGDAGDDLLSGGGGDDRLVGGAGSDTFVLNLFSDFERVLDWEDGVDLIDLSGLFYADAADALSDFVQQGSNVRIINNDDVMVISNALLADFDASDLVL